MSRFLLMASASFLFGLLAILGGASACVVLGWLDVDKNAADPISWAVVGSCWAICQLWLCNSVPE